MEAASPQALVERIAVEVRGQVDDDIDIDRRADAGQRWGVEEEPQHGASEERDPVAEVAESASHRRNPLFSLIRHACDS